MKKVKNKVVLICLTLALLRCTESLPVASGGTIETTNGYTITVIDQNGKAVNNAKIKVIDAENWVEKRKAGKSVVLDSLHTDKLGSAFIDSLFEHKVNVQVEKESFGLALVQNVLMGRGGQDTVLIKPAEKVLGKVRSLQCDVQELWVEGTDFSTTVLSNDSFALDLPEGPAALWAILQQPDLTTDFKLASIIDVQKGTNHLESITVMPLEVIIENFNDSDSKVLNTDLFGETNWYIAKSQNVLLQNPDTFNFSSYLSDQNSYDSSSFLVNYHMKYGDSLIVGFKFALDSGLDMSSFSSLRFMAIGDGIIHVTFLGESGSSERIAWYDYQLTNFWNEIRITPGMLNIASSDTELTPWSQLGKKITSFYILIQSGSFFSFDNLRISGL